MCVSDKNIVLIHGWGSSVERLQTLSRELKKLGWNTLPLKLPGFNLAPPKEVWGVDDYAKYVAEAADAKFNGEYFVFGHSFGGRVAIKLAARKSETQGIVLCSAGGISRPGNLRLTIFYFLAKTGKMLLLIRPVAVLFRKLLYKVARTHDYEVISDPMVKKIFRKIVSEDLKKPITLIKSPTLILWGENDGITPVKDAHTLKAGLKTSKLKIFEGEGHVLPYRKPKAVAEEIAKWAKELK